MTRYALTMVFFLAGLVSFTGCGRAYANKQTLVTSDCGVTWDLITPGSTLPAMLTPCQYKVTVPDFPLQGEVAFKTSFANRVLATVEITYDYSIVDAKAFIGEAKYLGKANSEGEDETNSAKNYESAENAVIDKRIRDVVTQILVNEDIVDFSQAEFEDKLLIEVNKNLEGKGVRLNFLSFVPIPEEQTRLAIDVATAIKIYESKGMGELGREIAVARAGATKIDVTTTTEK